VCIDHLAAVMQGEKVTSMAKVNSIDKRKINFSVEVLYKGNIIGNGIHERVIVDEKRFLEKLQG
ncbi:MAG: thioesterase family protein, partial [Candidatus Kariarchaeaceae archaeon]